MRRTLRYNLVDVFTDTPLTGNPLAVFTNGQGLTDETMQSIAREMNLSETVFFLPPEAGGHARLRIFTPRTELPFAGHPVLGSAWVLAGPMEMNLIKIETAAGVIPIELDRQSDRLHVAHMTQPLPALTPVDRGDTIRSALGASTGGNLLPVTRATNGPSHLLVEVKSREEVDALEPDFTQLARIDSGGTLAFAQDGDTCHARYFAPAAGIQEDPATGSAAGPLAALLVTRDRHPSGEQLIVRQGRKMKRPSLLLASATKEEGVLSSVIVGGSAVVIARGEMNLP